MTATRTYRTRLLAALGLLLLGAVAGFVAAASRPPAARSDELRVEDRELHLRPPQGEPLLVTESTWLALPQLRSDHRLTADVELGPGATLDLVVRRVEPRLLRGVRLPMHGRFRVLRVSTAAAGEPWRTPTTALLGEPGGARIGAGLPATIELEARGRELRALVAGKRLEPFLAADDYGSVALIARGGTVAVRALDITPLPPEPRLPLWLWGLLAALPAALLGALSRAHPLRLLGGGVVLVAAAELARRFALQGLPPLAAPEAATELLVVLAAAPLALAAVVPFRWLLLALVLAVGAGWLAADAARDRVLQRFPPTPELDALVGPDAGEDVIHALARRLRGPIAVHTLEPADHRVMLLGGELLYQRGASPGEHLELLLLGRLRAAEPEVDVVALPTLDGHAAQQWRLFETCYTGYRPQVLVFGVPLDEAVAVDTPDGRRPRSSPGTVRETVAAARAWCEQNDAALVVFAAPGLDVNLLAAARTAAGDAPVVAPMASAGPERIAEQLAAAIVPHL